MAVRLAFEALLLGGALALWVGLDVLFRDSQQAQGVPLAEGAGLVILGTGLCLTLVTVGRAIRSTKVAVPGDAGTSDGSADGGARRSPRRPSPPDRAAGLPPVEPTAVRNQHFRVILRGYDRREVDALLEKVAAAVAAGRHPGALVRQAGLHQRIPGYRRGDVDRFLDLLVTSWQPMGRPPPTPPKPGVGGPGPTSPHQPGRPSASPAPADRPVRTGKVFAHRAVQASLAVAVLGAAIFGVAFVRARSGMPTESEAQAAASNCPLALDEWAASLVLTPGAPGPSRAFGPGSPELAWIESSAKQLTASTMTAEEAGLFKRAESECILLWTEGHHIGTMPLPPQPSS